MGFWHTGYEEFHEPTWEPTSNAALPMRPAPCGQCGATFAGERDLAVHKFHGHLARRPLLLLKGRECGTDRLTVTSETTPEDWEIIDSTVVRIDGRVIGTAPEVAYLLASTAHGIRRIELINAQSAQEFEVEFSLPIIEDLELIDHELDEVIRAGELSRTTIDRFLDRCPSDAASGRYSAGIADYLFGVLARESSPGANYEIKFNRAVEKLTTFDRRPAEAICGIVAFHYNHFDRALKRTRSIAVAESSRRLQAMLSGLPWTAGSLQHPLRECLDLHLADENVYRILQWTAVPLDGTHSELYPAIAEAITGQRPSDATKLRMICAEYTLALGDRDSAVQHAEPLRHSPHTEKWYLGLRHRIQENKLIA